MATLTLGIGDRTNLGVEGISCTGFARRLTLGVLVSTRYAAAADTWCASKKSKRAFLTGGGTSVVFSVVSSEVSSGTNNTQGGWILSTSVQSLVARCALY